MNSVNKFDIELEIRSVREQLEGKKISAEEAQKKLEEIKVRKNEFEKQEAIMSAPVQNRSTSYADMRNSMIEKRAITLSGNGAINQVSDIVAEVQAKVPLLAEFKYFYGPNSQTNIPLLTPGLASPSQQVEGWTVADEDATAALSYVSITPVGFTKTLPVSWDALNLNSANFESQLPAFYGEVFGRTMHVLGLGKMFHSDGVAAANKVYASGSGSTGAAYPTLHDMIDLSYTLQDKTLLNPVMVCNSKMIIEALKTATDTATKIIAEEYYRNRTINGVRVILTSQASNVTTKDVIQVWGGELSNVGFGVASDLMIVPKQQVGSASTFFDATMFFNAKIIQPKNSYALIAK